MRTMGGRPVLLQRFPEGAGGPSFFQKRVPANAPDWLQTTTVSTPNGTTSQALVAADIDHVLWAVNLGCLGFHVWPYLAERPRPHRRAADRPGPDPGRGFHPDPRGGPGAAAAARRGRHHRLPEDDRQPRPARVRPAAAALGFLPGPLGRRGRRPRAGTAQARPDHGRVVEGGARAAGVRRLQPERAAQDRLRRVVGPGPAGRAGVHPGRLGRARRHPPGPVHDRVPGGPARRPPATRGWA